MCRAFLYLAHCVTLTDDQVLNLIPEDEHVFLFANDFYEHMVLEPNGRHVNTRLVKMFCKMNMLIELKGFLKYRSTTNFVKNTASKDDPLTHDGERNSLYILMQALR